MPRFLSSSLLARLVGAVLFVAAGLKVWGLGVMPVTGAGVFSALELQVGLVEYEILLAFWLWSGIRPIASWLVAIVTFSLFAAASCYLAWIGQSSCGCLGRISASPIYALTFDSVVLLGLILGRPPNLAPISVAVGKNLFLVLSRLLITLAGTATIAGCFLALAYYHFGSLPRAVAYFRGDRVSVQPRLVHLGECHSGEQRVVAVEVANWTANSVRVIGGARDCSCSV